MSRTFACGLITAALLGILVGCGPKPNPAPGEEGKVALNQKEPADEPIEKDLTNEDPGLQGNLEAALPDIARVDRQTVDAAITKDNLGQPNAPDSDTTGLALPGIASTSKSDPSTPSVAGVAIGGLGGFPGRSGGAKARLLREGGGNDGPRGKPAGGGAPKALPQDGHDGANAEKYGMYRENEFRSPHVAALSTFSADVNTASYSNVRRMLNQGTLPPKDAVFLAEFVNYFPYKYATPKGDDPVEFNLEMGPCPWNRKHHLVRIGVQAAKYDAEKMPPRNLVFLIDTSGSMSSANRLPLVKQALALLVDQLGDKDRVSIVTYAGDSRVALGPTKGSQKDAIKKVVTDLNANGGTNGEGGITKAYQLARDTFIEGGVNRVILCTDGDFNVGVTNHGDLIRMIEEQRRSKVFLTILGFGMGNYKDNVLKDLANHGNGHHAYIDTLDEAKKVFVEQGGALACVAKDVKFQVDFNPARVAAYRLVGYENRLLKDEDFKNDAKDAGDMGSGHQVTVFYEIVPVGVAIDLPGVDKSKYTIPTKLAPDAADEWLTVKMRYKQPDADVSKELAKALPSKALGVDLSEDFRFAAAAASFGMVLRDSHFRGAMTIAGVLEEAQGCVGDDPNGHRKEFLKLVIKAKELTVKPAAPSVVPDGQN